MKGCVYILQSIGGRYYIGSSENVEKRFWQHQSGIVHTTARMKDLQIVFKQEFADIASARKVEKWLKSLKRKDYITKIILDGKIRKEL
jgi:putative endonuclease